MTLKWIYDPTRSPLNPKKRFNSWESYLKSYKKSHGRQIQWSNCQNSVNNVKSYFKLSKITNIEVPHINQFVSILSFVLYYLTHINLTYFLKRM